MRIIKNPALKKGIVSVAAWYGNRKKIKLNYETTESIRS